MVATCRDGEHRFSKQPRDSVRLLAGLGVEGDAHAGRTVRHRSRLRTQAGAPNLRQVHLLGLETLERLRREGFEVAPGDLGENLTTRGVDLHALPRGTLLRVGEAELELTGLRNPCGQLDDFQPGLTRALLGRGEQGEVLLRGGVMAVVLRSGEVRPGDRIDVTLPAPPHAELERV
ncbi:MAG: MOSC domain-containing protein [Acidobacteria bacterium]|nr:MAG: MOSC domain-containing protein [Acidobacteriota bacterium]REK08448.1 MAG: MOSC domain-containing protein [Acidobacteriota bacterium]